MPGSQEETRAWRPTAKPKTRVRALTSFFKKTDTLSSLTHIVAFFFQPQPNDRTPATLKDITDMQAEPNDLPHHTCLPNNLEFFFPLASYSHLRVFSTQPHTAFFFFNNNDDSEQHFFFNNNIKQIA
jgi:hypothetical protein